MDRPTLHLIRATYAEAFARAPDQLRTNPLRPLFLAVMQSPPDENEGPGLWTAVNGAVVRASSAERARRVADDEGATVIEVLALGQPDEARLGVAAVVHVERPAQGAGARTANRVATS